MSTIIFVRASPLSFTTEILVFVSFRVCGPLFADSSPYFRIEEDGQSVSGLCKKDDGGGWGGTFFFFFFSVLH